jgi:hypothetical protein
MRGRWKGKYVTPSCAIVLIFVVYLGRDTARYFKNPRRQRTGLTRPLRCRGDWEARAVRVEMVRAVSACHRVVHEEEQSAGPPHVGQALDVSNTSVYTSNLYMRKCCR